MVTTRSKVRKLNNDGSGSWPSLGHDLLLNIMMRIGLFDFIALSGVCKSWRSAAVSNWKEFMMSKQPMYLSLSKRVNGKDCYLEENCTQRKMNTVVPHSRGRVCVGLTCGYLIFFGRDTRDFWLVNPVTRKELHFPGFPYSKSASSIPSRIKGILVFSPSLSGWVLVVLAHGFLSELYFSLAGKQVKWSYVSLNSVILDIHFFKGKIYTMNTNKRLFEFRLNPVPAFILHKMNNSPWADFRYDTLVSSGGKLYLMNTSNHFDAIEVNFEKCEWMNEENTLGKLAVFTSVLKCDAVIEPVTWARTQYKKLNYADDGNHKNGALLNILEEESKKAGGASSCGSIKRVGKLVIKRLDRITNQISQD
ncbi:F-box/kelch-repeat protein At1g57790-like [Bidens hawaiensis]|uniref:F-box/kelch-repeat protein At1g57790-like n=1 Tax=Bidens hawaiensis TaxID=980011 RepID=UPI00404B48D8